MKINYLFLFFLTVITNLSQAQDFSKIYFEIDAVSKLSIGEAKTEQFEYEPDLSIIVPKISTHDNPIYGLNFSFNYQLNSSFSAGIGSGVNFVLEELPVSQNNFHNKVMIPFFARFRYQTNLNTHWTLLSDLNAGYQYVDFKNDYTENVYVFKETGGLLLNFDLGLGVKIARFTPTLKVGYELNQASHEVSMGWIPNHDYEDKVNYTTYYHLLKLSLSLKL